METYLTIEELAGYLKLAEQTIRRWVHDREIPYCKIRRSIRFRVSEIENWIDGAEPPNGGALIIPIDKRPKGTYEGGYVLPTETLDGIEGDLFDGLISLDELAEIEYAHEEAKDEA